MAEDNEVYRRLAEELYRPATLGKLREVFRSIDSCLAKEEITVEQASELRANALRSMKDASAGDFTESRDILLEMVLPPCLAEAGNDDEGGIARYRYREILRDWLNELTEPSRTKIREEVLRRVIKSLEGAEAQKGCWVVAALGYRDPDVTEALWNATQSDNEELADAALACLSDLGLPTAEKNRLITEASNRARDRCNSTLIGVMWRLAEADTFETIERYWMRQFDQSVVPQLSHHIVRVVAELLSANPDKWTFHDEVWSRMLAFSVNHVDRLGTDLHLDNNLAPFCNSPNVIPFILSRLVGKRGSQEDSKNHRYIIYRSLETCAHSRQLEGWNLPVDSVVEKILWEDASRDTRQTSIYLSPATKLRQLSCEGLFCLAETALCKPETYETLVGSESSSYVRSKVSDLLACLRIDPLPASAINWVTERANIDRKDAGEQLPFRASACQVLRSAGTRHAFEVLSNFGYTISGAVLKGTLDALVDLAVHLVLRGDTTVVTSVMEILSEGIELHQRDAASEVLMHLALLNLIPPQLGDDLAQMALNDDRGDYERSRIVAALSHLHGFAISHELENQIVQLCGRRNHLGKKALEFLARRDRLIKHENLLHDCLGLRRSQQGWLLDDASSYGIEIGYLIGHLFLNHPRLFIDVVCKFIVARDWIESAQLIHILDFTYCVKPKSGAHPEVVNALVERILLSQSESAADLELFGFLARWDPSRLVSERWENFWNDWMADARVSLADAFAGIPRLDGIELVRTVEILLALTGDGTFAVRRSAYRSLAHISAESLEAFVLACSSSPSWELRRRGAEACGWIVSDDPYTSSSNHFESDPESLVRNAAKRARSDRRTRQEGLQYLEIVTGCKLGDNNEILSAWKFGRALQQIGDDSCIERLLKHIQQERLPSNVRHWLRMILKELNSHWREVTQKWPDPWLSWKGSIEEGQGFIRTGELKTNVKYTLWMQPASQPSEYGEWGGVALSLGQPSEYFSFFSISLGDAELSLANGRRGTIIVTNQTNNRFSFSGQGPYPSFPTLM